MVLLCFAPLLCAELTLGNESLTELLIQRAAGTRSGTATAEVVLLDITGINVQLGKYLHCWSD